MTNQELFDRAAEIKRKHLHIRRALPLAREIGVSLIEVKDSIAPGQWEQWVGEHCELKKRMAERYMLIARRWADLEASRVSLGDLSLRGALALLAERRAKKPAGQTLSVTIRNPVTFKRHADALMSDNRLRTRGELFEWALEKLFDEWEQRERAGRKAA